MKVALDTNVLAYAEGVNAQDRRAAALDIIGRLPGDSVVLPVQVLGELFNVLVRKARRAPAAARLAILAWHDTYSLIETSPAAILAAADLAAVHRFGIWDAVILATAAEGGCRLLLSEDMHEGFSWNGITVVNPFAATQHALFAALMTRH